MPDLTLLSNLTNIIYRMSVNPGGSTLFTNGLLASWVLDDKPALPKFDYSGNGYHLSQQGEPPLAAGSDGISFNGLDERLYTNNASASGLYQATADPLTVAVSVQFNDDQPLTSLDTAIAGIWDAGSLTNKRGWLVKRRAFDADASQPIQLSVSSSGTDQTNIIFGSGTSLNTLYHIVARYDQSNLKLFVNGTHATDVAYSSGILRDTSIDFQVARYDAPNNTDIYSEITVHNLSIWNRSLSDAEVDEWYNGGSPKTVPFAAVE